MAAFRAVFRPIRGDDLYRIDVPTAAGYSEAVPRRTPRLHGLHPEAAVIETTVSTPLAHVGGSGPKRVRVEVVRLTNIPQGQRRVWE